MRKIIVLLWIMFVSFAPAIASDQFSYQNSAPIAAHQTQDLDCCLDPCAKACGEGCRSCINSCCDGYEKCCEGTFQCCFKSCCKCCEVTWDSCVLLCKGIDGCHATFVECEPCGGQTKVCPWLCFCWYPCWYYCTKGPENAQY